MPVPLDEPPLVTIAIPTYNRAELLHRSVESALGQDHARLEVLIGDNASTDGTLAVAEAFAARDDRVRVLTNERNAGPTANFNRLRAAAAGDYFMWLGDDDWIDLDYVSACLDALRDDPAAALATGRVLYHGPEGQPWEGVRVEPRDAVAARRVAQYWEAVRDNGAFYGLMPASVSAAVPPLGGHMGNDMHLLAAVAYLGRFRVVDAVAVHRAVGGATTSLKRVAEVGGLPWWQGEVPQLAIALFAFREVAWRSPLYRDRGPVSRLALAVRSAWIPLRRFLPEAVPKYLRLMRTRIVAVGRRVGRRAAG